MQIGFGKFSAGIYCKHSFARTMMSFSRLHVSFNHEMNVVVFVIFAKSFTQNNMTLVDNNTIAQSKKRAVQTNVPRDFSEQDHPCCHTNSLSHVC